VKAHDTNVRVAALLRDLAAAQTTRPSRWGYRRAAEAVLALEEPLEALVQPDGTLRKIPNVGPSSTRVVLEVLRTGRSAIVEAAMEARARSGDADRAVSNDPTFLSHVQVLDALSHPIPRAVRPAEYRGDLQMHSEFSDGRTTVSAMAEGCRARGYSYCAVTDHGYGLSIANGVSMSDLKRQHAEIDTLNRGYKGRFRVLKGIEANILADGALDLKPRELRRLELVVAAPHSRLRATDDQTTRLVSAVCTPGVHILGHPRGRKFRTRSGIRADWGVVFATAAKYGVAIEIDGDPSRQDIDFMLAGHAAAAGCLFALDSDAHSVAELSYVDTAIAHARLAAIPRTRIINCWPLAKLRAWLAKAWGR
jgi:histidinol phosphatase-like PHP family hydrolase